MAQYVANVIDVANKTKAKGEIKDNLGKKIYSSGDFASYYHIIVDLCKEFYENSNYKSNDILDIHVDNMIIQASKK